jgi:hypothetical protein
MTILAVYYTLADIVLLGQCFYYRGFTFSDASAAKKVPGAVDEEAVEEEEATEQTSLLPHKRPTISDVDRPSARGSFSSFRSRLSSTHVSATHLSPATPFMPPSKPTSTPPALSPSKPKSPLYTLLFNTTALILVSAIGVLGWWLSPRPTHTHTQYPPAPPTHHHKTPHPASPTPSPSTPLPLSPLGQTFGYLCATLYLTSRIPQLLLNHRRKSTEGVSMLFFLFACVGNMTYVLSIFAYEPACARIGRVDGAGRGREGGGGGGGFCEGGEWGKEYGRYILVNASWVIGSAGTLVLDLLIFGQFWMYRDR